MFTERLSLDLHFKLEFTFQAKIYLHQTSFHIERKII